MSPITIQEYDMGSDLEKKPKVSADQYLPINSVQLSLCVKVSSQVLHHSSTSMFCTYLTLETAENIPSRKYL